MTTRPRLRFLAAVLAPLALLAAACGGDDGETADTTAPAGGGDTPEIIIGIQDFGESKVLAYVYGGALEAQGYNVSYKELGGYRDIVYASFQSGDINFTPDYAASALEFLNEGAGEASADVEETTNRLRELLGERNLRALDAAPAQNTNTFVVTRATADGGVTGLGDLTPEMRLGGPQDCPTNPFCIPALLETYEVDLSGNFKALDGGGPLTKTALRGGEIDVAVLFSTDPAIEEEDWVVLADEQGILAAENIIPVMTVTVADGGGEALQTIVDRISAAITTERLLAMNKRFDIDKDDADAIARDFLEEHGLI